MIAVVRVSSSRIESGQMASVVQTAQHALVSLQ